MQETRIQRIAHAWRRSFGCAAVSFALVAAACGDGGDPAGPGNPGPGPGPGPAPGTRVLPDTLDVATLVDAVVDHMPRRNTNGYAPPSPDQRIAMVGILAEARAGRVARADSLADRYDYDVEATVDALHGDTLLVMIERTPIERGWGTYIIRKGAAPADVHVNHPLFDVNTPDVAVALYNACRCRALLIAGTHRYANGGDESDMARATGSIFQGVHEALAEDATMAVSVHGFAPMNHSAPTSNSDAILSLGADAYGDIEANDDARDLRDRVRAGGFVVGLVEDDPGYNELTGSPNPQGRYSNTRFGHGRWIHVEISGFVLIDRNAYTRLTGIIAGWLTDLVS